MLAVLYLHLTITHDPTRLLTSQAEGLSIATYGCPGTRSPEYLRLKFDFTFGVAPMRHAGETQDLSSRGLRQSNFVRTIRWCLDRSRLYDELSMLLMK